MLKPAVLSIFIKGKPVVQGKFCLVEGKPAYIANMTERKLYVNYGGYAIAKRLLDAFSKAKIRPLMLYKRVDKNLHYRTTRSRFEKKAILVKDGDHSQWVLPLRNWEVVKGLPEEPYNLPVMDINAWLKTQEVKEKRDSRYDGSMSEYMAARQRLAEAFRAVVGARPNATLNKA